MMTACCEAGCARNRDVLHEARPAAHSCLHSDQICQESVLDSSTYTLTAREVLSDLRAAHLEHTALFRRVHRFLGTIHKAEHRLQREWASVGLRHDQLTTHRDNRKER